MIANFIENLPQIYLYSIDLLTYKRVINNFKAACKTTTNLENRNIFEYALILPFAQ